MALSVSQQQTLKAAIDADPALSSKPNNSDGNFDIAKAFNAIASPDFTVWRTNVAISEIMSNGFDWTRVDNATVGKARIWEWMARLGSINPSKANIRAGINEAWSGTGAEQVAHRNAIFTHCKRNATRAEKLFATGTGSVGDPATMTFEGSISGDDVEAARNS